MDIQIFQGNKAIISTSLILIPVTSRYCLAKFCHQAPFITVLGTLQTLVLPNFFPPILLIISPKLHTVLFKDCVTNIFPNIVCAFLQFWTFKCSKLKALSLQVTRNKTLFNLIFNTINGDLFFKEANNYRARENIAEMMPDPFYPFRPVLDLKGSKCIFMVSLLSKLE